MNECDSELSDLEETLLKYPGLVMSKLKNNDTCFQGPVKVKDIWFNIKLICPNFPHINNLQLQVQQNLFIKTYSSAQLNISIDWTLEDLIENLPTLIGTSQSPIHIWSNTNDNAPTNIYAEIVNLYAPTEYEILLNDNCSLVRFIKFSNNEHHFLEVELPDLKVLEHSLPSCIDWPEMLGRTTSLTMLLQQYKIVLEDLRPFYENFTDIDELCYVVQPRLPNYKVNWRLFVLKERVFLKVQFKEPFSPLNSMSVHIIGPTTEVTRFRRIYSEGMRDWDGDLNVHKNLLRIFDLCFFPMEVARKTSQHCNICYCYKLDQGEIPIVSCDSNHCSLIYHAACLKEWFNTLAHGKTFLDVAFGECPFCKAKLSTSFQEILE